MECERCGRENYDESYYCRNCGAELDHSDITIDRTSFSRPNNYLNQYQSNSRTYQSNSRTYQSNSRTYQNNNQYSQQTTKSTRVNTDNKQYSYSSTSADNKQSSYDNTSTDSKQFDYDNTSKDNKTFEYYSTPPTSRFDYDNYLAHREPSKFDTARAKVLKVNGVLYIVGVFVFAILILLFECFSTFHYDIPFFSGSYRSSSQATEPVTEPEDYTARLSYDIHIVTDSSSEHLEALFPVPEGYKYESSGSDSLALFYRNVNNTEVTFSTSFFKGDLQDEIDYYSGLHGEDGKIFNMEVTDTHLGEMTLITLTRADKTTVYQAYIKTDEEYYFHISLSNIPVEYKVEAYKLIDLIIEDTTIEFIDNENRFKDEFEN